MAAAAVGRHITRLGREARDWMRTASMHTALHTSLHTFLHTSLLPSLHTSLHPSLHLSLHPSFSGADFPRTCVFSPPFSPLSCSRPVLSGAHCFPASSPSVLLMVTRGSVLEHAH